MTRDPVAEIIEYNRPLTDEAHRVRSADGARDLTAEALRRKLDALGNTPFQFFRGTFHLMAWDIFKDRVPGAKATAPEGWIVGDLHLENFGIYRGASGALCFDVNDFDDVGLGPIDVDLKRLCTSAMLLPGLAPGVRSAASKAIARAWAEEVEKLGGRFPVPPWDEKKAEGRVETLLGERGHKTRAELIAKAAPDKNHRRFDDGGTPTRFAHVGKNWERTVEAAVAEYLEALKQLKAPDPPKGWDVLDSCYRFKGTGSLGRLRFTALLGNGNERRMVEIKEARTSCMDDARLQPSPRDRARAQTAAIRRLQGDPWPRVAATHLGKVAALGRENEPEEEKVGSDRFAQGDAKHEELQAYCRQCGQVLARLHCRENAPMMFDAAWSSADAARAAAEFAEKYAAQVEADQKAFAKAKPQVAQALGV